MPTRTAGAMRAFIALFILSLLWGYNWVVMKYALAYAGPFQFGALRTFGGALCLIVLLLVMRRTGKDRHKPAHTSLPPSCSPRAGKG